MKYSPWKVQVVDAGPLPPENIEVPQELIKKAALRKLRQLQYEVQRKSSD